METLQFAKDHKADFVKSRILDDIKSLSVNN